MRLEWKAQNKAWRVHGLMWHELDMLEAYCKEARKKQSTEGKRPVPKQDNDILGGVAAIYLGVDDDTPKARELVADAIDALLNRLEKRRNAELHDRLTRSIG